MNDNNDNMNAVDIHPTLAEFQEIWKKNSKILTPMKPTPRRVVDQYSREEIEGHVARFAQHCAAKQINPTVGVIIDWLYSEKAFDEKDDFVKIEKLIELVKSGQVYPILILEVLEYAKKVEEAAIKVNDKLGHLSDDIEELGELKDALNLRLEVRKSEQQQQQQ